MSETDKRPFIVHVSPTYFAAESFVGGGERFVEEIAAAMAQDFRVKLVAFGPRAQRSPLGPHGERVVLRNWTRDKMTPFSPHLTAELRGADVVHCHQYFTLSTFVAAWFGRLQGSRVYVTDLGGGGWTPGYQIDISRWIDAHLPLSHYAARGLPGANKNYRVIGGGVDLIRYGMRPQPEHDGSVVFLGRILPHKGVHFLIEAMPPEMELHVIGPTSDSVYLDRLERLAEGKRVRFHHGLSDESVVERLQTAMALVHPTPVDEHGDAGVNELFGLVLVEAMACGCPVIASAAASLPEIVDDGVTGFLVPPNDPQAIRERLEMLDRDRAGWTRQSLAARRRVELHFGWSRVVDECLQAYEGARR